MIEQSGQTPPERSTAEAHKDDTPSNPPLRENQSGNGTHDGKPVAERETAGARGKKRSPEEWIAQGTIASAIVGFFVLIGQVIVAAEMNGQRTIMAHQLREMRSGNGDTHNLATAAKQQADTLEKQLAIFQQELDTMRYQQRPNVRMLPEGMPSHPGQVAWNVHYEDVGLRDAQNADLNLYMSIAGGPFYQAVRIRDVTLHSGLDNYSTVVSRAFYTEAEYQALLRGSAQIRVFATVDYADQDGKKAHAEECWVRVSSGAVGNQLTDKCATELAKDGIVTSFVDPAIAPDPKQQSTGTPQPSP